MEQQRSLFDEEPPGSPLKGNNKRIYDALLARLPAGLIGDQLEVLLELSHQTTSAALAGLKKAGWIKETGQSRRTRSGYLAAVVVAIPEPLIVTRPVAGKATPAKPARRRPAQEVTGDICSNRHGGNIYSEAAHRRLIPIKTAQQRRVYAGFKAYPTGTTSEQVSTDTGMIIQTVTARASDLQAMGLLIKTHEKRPTRSGRLAAVLVAKY